MKRLKRLPTLHINPSEKHKLVYCGRPFQGFNGDTIATALFANGIRIFSRSLKYHRPRGLYCLDGECSNTYMEINGIPNIPAENTLLENGMIVKAQNTKGSAQRDWLSFMDKLDWIMPAGFYYRIMHKPAALWPIAMKQIRKIAGLGSVLPNHKMQGQYDELFLKVEVTIIGGGAAGMSAALAASESGLRVVLLESRPHLGGNFNFRVSTTTDGIPLYKRAHKLAEKIKKTENIRVFEHTSMIGIYNKVITASQTGKSVDVFSERYIEIYSQSVVVATGCIERPLIFDNNERPGVMQVSCAHRMARLYGLLPGKKAVFSVGHDLGLEAAVDLFDLGLKVSCVADIREDGQDPALELALAKREIPLLRGWVAAKVRGSKMVEKVVLTTLEGIKQTFACDLLVASAGLTPVTAPLVMAHASMKYDNHTGYFLPSKLPSKMFIAGCITGINSSDAIETSGRLAGFRAAASVGADLTQAIGEAKKKLLIFPGPERGSKLVTVSVKERKSFICFDGDVTIKSVKQAIDMGFYLPELVKRFAGIGLGPGQNNIPGHNLSLFMAKYTISKDMPQPTTVRPPLKPTFISTYAGYNHHMFKHTPLYNSQKTDGGVFRNFSGWQRAQCFSNDLSCREEVLNVRNNVGMFDGSSLGKFRICGPNAINVLQRVYVSDITKVNKGLIKYSAMCNDDGCVIDDGIIAKLGENDYYFTTSTNRADQTIEWIRYHTRFDNWDFNLVNLTDGMGIINLSGPNARKVLEKVVDIDISNEAFPFSGYREFLIKNIVFVRAMRVGFVGELSYELHVPSSYTQSLWNLLKKAGTEFGIRNFGVEAQNILRMEKCHIILGQESEQRTNLLDLGLGFLWDQNKFDAKTVGAVALRQAETNTGRFKLIGICMEDDARTAHDGALIVDKKVRGYITTMRKNFITGKSIGMALVESQLSNIGTRLEIFENECKDVRLYAKVISIPFYDPEGKRMRM